MAGLFIRFQSFIEMPENLDDCWIWSGNTHRQGYGKFSFMGKSIPAHRMSYEIHKGHVVGNSMVCHRCDNPSCVNPSHLFLGSAKDNMADKVSKGRHKGAHKGSCHHLAILDDEKVCDIRRLYKSGEVTQYTLAEKFNVSQSLISNIVNNSKWSHI